ncbi:MAG: helix-turn-helix domain-containing protein [Phenylobacterium sp.]|uniref:helix-turn-helix domain-containing protein n=1 Tax=Phenylobacterium sp. TaxID=1871053 RepID=UPI00391B14DE
MNLAISRPTARGPARKPPHPTFTNGPSRDWGSFGARRLSVTPGRYEAQAAPEHRLIFYLGSPVPTLCACADLSGRRLQTAGDFDLLPAGAEGFWEDAAPAEMVSIRLTPRLLLDAADAMGAPAGAADPAPLLGGRDGRIEHVVRALLAELECDTPGGRLFADSLANALALRLVKDFHRRGLSGSHAMSRPQLRRVIEHIEAHLAEDLPLADIARAAGLSVPHLSALFRRTMGRSVHAYVMERRVARARDLLLAGRSGQAEIALACGFAHQSHMARWTRRILGLTPAQLRRA